MATTQLKRQRPKCQWGVFTRRLGFASWKDVPHFWRNATLKPRSIAKRYDVREPSDRYIRDLLSRNTDIPKHAWPLEVIALKRAELLGKRKLWKRRRELQGIK